MSVKYQPLLIDLIMVNNLFINVLMTKIKPIHIVLQVKSLKQFKSHQTVLISIHLTNAILISSQFLGSSELLEMNPLLYLLLYDPTLSIGGVVFLELQI